MVTLFVFVMGLISVTISIILVYKKKIQEFNPMSFLIFVLLLIFILAVVSMKYWSDHKKLIFCGRFILFLCSIYFSNLDNLWFNLNAFSTTETELKLIAAPAIIGLNNGPPKKCKTPIATGIPITL